MQDENNDKEKEAAELAEQEMRRAAEDIQREMVILESDLKKMKKTQELLQVEIRKLKADEKRIQTEIGVKQKELAMEDSEVGQQQEEIKKLQHKLNTLH